MTEVTGLVDNFEGLYLNGWAIAHPDTRNCDIEVRDLAGRVIAKARASRERPDLGSLGRGRRNFAFRISLAHVEPGEFQVFANGIELPKSPVMVGEGRFDGVVSVIRGVVHGWVSERTPNAEPPVVEIRDQEDRILASGRPAKPRKVNDPVFIPASFSLPFNDAAFGRSELQLRAFANGVLFARFEAPAPEILGFIESYSPEHGSGWLLAPEFPDRVFEVQAYWDGRFIGRGRVNQPREDVLQSHPGFPNSGFFIRYESPPREFAEIGTLSFRLAGADVELFGGPFAVGRRVGMVRSLRAAAQAVRSSTVLGHTTLAAVSLAAIGGAVASHRADADYLMITAPGRKNRIRNARRTCVIVPVYRGIEVTRTCIESVLAHRAVERDAVILINDCSPDPGMAEMLAFYADQPNVFLLSNAANQGFIRTVNRGLRFLDDGDPVLLNSDTRVFAGWLDELLAVADSSPEIGTVTALSNNATIYTYPNPRMPSADLPDTDWPTLAAIALKENAGVAIDMPTGHGFCMLVKRSVIDEVGLLNEAFGRGYGEENEFCMRAADLGYRNVAAAGVFVEHRESISFGSERADLISRNIPQLERMFPEYTPMVMDYEERDDLRAARWPMDVHRLGTFGQEGGRFALVVTNWLTGGTRVAIEDIEATGLYEDLTSLVLTCDERGQLHLECSRVPVHSVFSAEEHDKLFNLLSCLTVDFTIVHQLLGFTTSFIRALTDWSRTRHTVAYVHDFYPACPRVTLIDALDEFCHVPNVGTCARCVFFGGSHEASRLEALTPREHRELFGKFLGVCAHVVAPSADTVSYMRRAFSDISPTVLPHPELTVRTAAATVQGGIDNVVLLGALGPHKGARRLLELAGRARITHPNLTFHVVGYTSVDDALLELGNVKITGRYRFEELPGIVAETHSRVALFLHVWPETFSYTLTEAFQLGLLPMVPDLGAPAERVRAVGHGLVFSRTASASEILRLIEGLQKGGVFETKPPTGLPRGELAAAFRALRRPAEIVDV